MYILKIAIGIATAGRREVLSETVKFLARQTRAPDELIICPSNQDGADSEFLREIFPAVKIVFGETGLPAQRNTIIAGTSADLLVFFDDDFLPADDYLLEIERLFETRTDVAVATGLVLADGILGPGLTFAEAVDAVGSSRPPASADIEDVYNGYGCNMTIRLDIVRAKGLRFDENLPLYGWLEDVDFSRQLSPFGCIIKSSLLRGVHMGTKRSGRSPGRQLGYSQVANPIYLARKGTMSWRRAINQILRNFAANLLKSRNPELWVDRRGRLNGNILAIREYFSGQLYPTRILLLDRKV